MGAKTKEHNDGLTWKDAEKIARNAIRERIKWANRREIDKCVVVRSLGPDRNTIFMFLVEARGNGPSGPLYAKVFVDSLTGETYPSDATGNPIHEISSAAEYNSYYDAGWVSDVFKSRRPGKPEPRFWSLVQSTPQTTGYVELNRQGETTEKNQLWQLNVTSNLPVWLVTDTVGDDFLVFSNGIIGQVFNLDPEAKKGIGHLVNVNQNGSDRK